MKGPAIFLAQFAGTKPPLDKLETMAQWAASLGYVGVQVPTDAKLFDLEQAAKSQAYCDEIAGKLADADIVISELSTHLQGQLVAVHPAYAPQFAAFAPQHLRNKPNEWQERATQQLKHAAKASQRLKLKAHTTFSGALLWHTMYPWPQRPAGLVEAGFKELAKRWRPILDAFDDAGVDVCFEIHPSEDLHDGATFERFLDAVGGLWRLPRLARSARPVPVARRRADRLHGHLFEARTVRLRRLGRARVGVLLEASRGRRARGRAVHPLAHDPQIAARVRRFRRDIDGPEGSRAHSRPGPMTKRIES